VKIRRAVILAGVCAALGAATSVALALSLAWLRTPVNTFQPRIVALGRPARPYTINATIIVCHVWWFEDQHRFGERTLYWGGTPSSKEYDERLPGRPSVCAPIDRFFDREYLPNPADRPLERLSLNVVRAYGWPLFCVWEGEMGEGTNARLMRWPWNGPSYGGIRIGKAPAMGHFLPTLPLWPGLIVDTSVYGAMWLGLILLAAPARRGWRRRRGLCVWCRYDLRGLAPGVACPECGRGTVRQ
jgi:hypothetical protein